MDEAQSATPPSDPGQRSNRDLDQTRTMLQTWLARTLPSGAEPAVSKLASPSSNGMSSETLLFDATWNEDGARVAHELVARVAPADGDVPVFPTYDLHRQYRVIREVGARSDVPVPRTFWSEPDAGAIGSPFFVMGRVEGDVPPDVMPYNFGESWLFHASPADQARLQAASVDVLVKLHAIKDPTDVFSFLRSPRAGTPMRAQVDEQRAYYEWALEGRFRSPLIERIFGWLEDHWPADEGEPVLSWGDSRIGNMMYRDFTPVAVLDWEMAALGPREIDLAWMIFMHRVFEDLASGYGFAGMPAFMRRDEVLTAYEKASGHTPRDIDFYAMYAGLRWAIVSVRTTLRQIHFGQAAVPDDPDDLMLTRDTLERMVAGSYWDAVG